MADDFRIDVRDLRKLKKALNGVDKEFGKELRKANKTAAETVLAETKPPVLSGALDRATGVKASQTSASIKSGSKTRVPYGPPIHWGWRDRNIEPNEYIYDGIRKTRKKVEEAYTKALENVLKDAGISRRF